MNHLKCVFIYTTAATLDKNIGPGQTKQNLKSFLEIIDLFVLQTKEERADTITSAQVKSLMVWRCISAYGSCNLHICKGTINAYTKVYTGFRATYASIQTMSFSEKVLQDLPRQC